MVSARDIAGGKEVPEEGNAHTLPLIAAYVALGTSVAATVLMRKLPPRSHRAVDWPGCAEGRARSLARVCGNVA
jgi:hypothetical protein